MGLFSLSPLIAPPPVALTFGAATGDAVDIGSSALIDDTPGINPGTLISIVRLTTFTSNRGLFQKFSGGSTNWRISGVAGDVQFACTRATTITSYITGDTPLILNQWGIVAVTYDVAATPTTHIYGSGALHLPAVERAYGTAQDGSGAVSSNAAANAKIGNNGGATAAMQGDHGPFAALNRVVTLAEVRYFQRWMQEWYLSPTIYPGLIAAYALGAAGTKVHRDLTGNKNDGTVSGATVTRGIVRSPLRRIAYIPVDPPAGGSTFTDSRTESLTAAESEAATADFTTARAESLTAADTETATFTAVVARAESLTAADSATSALAAGVSLTESLTAVAVEAGALIAPVARTESLTASDSQDASVVSAGASTATESVTATDSQSAVVVYAAARAEALTVVDTCAEAAPAADNTAIGLVRDRSPMLSVLDRSPAIRVKDRSDDLLVRDRSHDVAVYVQDLSIRIKNRGPSL